MANLIHRIEENIIALLLVSMTLLVFVETILRFGFGTGLLWAEELTLHLSAWMVLFGASYGLREGAHIGVDFLVRKFSESVQRLITLLVVTVSLIYCGLFIAGSWTYLSKIYKVGVEMEDLPVPKWFAHSILLIGFILLGVRLLQITVRVWRREQFTINVYDEAAEIMEVREEASKEVIE